MSLPPTRRWLGSDLNVIALLPMRAGNVMLIMMEGLKGRVRAESVMMLFDFCGFRHLKLFLGK